MRDCDIRNALKPLLVAEFAGSQTLIVDELGFSGNVARADLAVINCSLHAYEIKSDRDTLVRLPVQLKHYSEQFHFVTVVATDKHLKAVLELASDHIGVMCATRHGNTVKFKEIRKASRLSQSIDRIARLFWWNEAVAVLEKHNLAKGTKRQNGDQLRAKLMENLCVNQLLAELRASLALRREKQVDLQPSRGDDLFQSPEWQASFPELLWHPLQLLRSEDLPN